MVVTTNKNPKTSDTRKELASRNSLLIDLFENDHIRTVYHMFLATFVAFFINCSLKDYLEHGQLNLGIRRILNSFEKINLVLLIWVGFFFSTCLCYLIFKIWVAFKKFTPSKSDRIRSWDLFGIFILLSYYTFSFRIAALIVLYLDLPPASASIVLLEQTRFLMKLHAFVRFNAEKVLKFKPHSDETLEISSFDKYLYFLFAPTLIYKDHYPRSEKIRWNFIFFRVLEVIGALFYMSFIIDRLVDPTILKICDKKLKIYEIIIIMFENSVSGILLLLSCFFLILHSWQNIFAELLRFGDRLFYKDWWNCTSQSAYFRRWNLIVHNWLYQYIYKDVYEILAPKRKTVAKVAVFLISLIVHEYIVTYMFGFFFPLIFVLFSFGIILTFIAEPPNNSLFNVIFLYSLALGTGFIISIIGIEYYSRFKVPNSTSWDFYLPRFLNCVDYN